MSHGRIAGHVGWPLGCNVQVQLKYATKALIGYHFRFLDSRCNATINLEHQGSYRISRKVTDEDAETILWSTAENQTVHAHAAGCSHEGDECGTMLHIDRLGDVKLSQMLPNGNGTNPAGFHLTRGPDRLILRVPHDTE